MDKKITLTTVARESLERHGWEEDLEDPNRMILRTSQPLMAYVRLRDDRYIPEAIFRMEFPQGKKPDNPRQTHQQYWGWID